MDDDRCDICGHSIDDHRPDGGACYVARCRCTGEAPELAEPEPPPKKKKSTKKKATKKKKAAKKK